MNVEAVVWRPFQTALIMRIAGLAADLETTPTCCRNSSSCWSSPASSGIAVNRGLRCGAKRVGVNVTVAGSVFDARGVHHARVEDVGSCSSVNSVSSIANVDS